MPIEISYHGPFSSLVAPRRLEAAGADRSLSRTGPSLAHTLDETLQDREAVVPDLRVAEVDADDGQLFLGRRRAAGREQTLVAFGEAGLARAITKLAAVEDLRLDVLETDDVWRPLPGSGSSGSGSAPSSSHWCVRSTSKSDGPIPTFSMRGN
jgi:hypothetical protein